MQVNVLPTLTSPYVFDLRRVLVIRNFVLAGLALAVAVVGYNLDMPLPYALIIGVLLAVNAGIWVRLRSPTAVGKAELFAFLLFDVLALTALLYFVGGATNPFVLLLLLPLIINAATLGDDFTWGMVAVIVACYTLLMFIYIPLPNGFLSYSTTFNLKTWGMWFGFVLTTELVAYLVSKIATTLHDRERELADIREQALRAERLVALGALAVGAAHELGTPLGTMAILLNDLEREYLTSPDLTRKLAILRAQVERCKGTLSNMLSSTGQSRAESGYGIALDCYLDELLAEWQVLRPAVQIQHLWQGSRPAPRIVAEKTLGHAFINILNNAADASPDNLEMLGKWNDQELSVEILDRGPGLPPEIAASVGQLFFTTKEAGHGVGLYLAQAVFGRFGGALHLTNRDGGGACTRVTLPLTRLLASG